jgi:cell division septation protein DedD
LTLAFSSCSSQKSAYRKAYEKAQAQQNVNDNTVPQQTTTPVVTPLEEKSANQTTVTDNVDNATVRTESVELISGSGLKDYSIVVGSFSLKANAIGLQNTLKSAGYDAQIAYNSGINMYRVVASTFASKSEAVSSRNQFRQKYPDAWLLFKK